MKLYVAGRFQSYAKVRGVIDRLQSMGHTITYDWTRSPEFDSQGEPVQADPHSLSPQKLLEYAVADLDGVLDADAVVVCADDSLAGAYIELGYGLAHGCQIYVIAHDRWTIFYELPEVRRFSTYDDFFFAMETPAMETV